MKREPTTTGRVLTTVTRWRGWSLLAAALGVALADASWAAGGGGHGGHGEGAPHINWWSWDMDSPPVGWFIINFIIFVGALWFFAKGPLRRAFSERHETIKNAIHRNANRQQEAEQKREEARAKLAQADDEAQQLLADSKAQGHAEYSKIVENADNYAERLRKDTSSLMDQELQRAVQTLQAETVERALARAEQLVRDNMSDADRLRLVDEAIAGLEDGSTPATHASGAAPEKRAAGGAA